MSFLSPLFFLGLAAIAVPVLVHLIQRERKRVIEFPSLMFVRRIPYQSVRRRRIRHWFLLLMRAAAIALIVAAFARPFLAQSAAAAAAASGDREVVLLSINPRAWATAITGRRPATARSRRSGRSGPTTKPPSCCLDATPRNRSAPQVIAGASKRRSTPRA